MRLLLDTHALIWAAGDPAMLSGAALEAMREPANDVFVSAVSGWEIAIKRARGRLWFPGVDRAMLAALRLSELPVTLAHGTEAGGLPAHHRDPFDRMLIAQGRVEGLTIVSRDRVFTDYDVALLW